MRIHTQLPSRRRAGAGLLLALGSVSVALADDPTPHSAKGAASSRVARATFADDADSSTTRIEKLIRELGHSHYTIRRAAANELRQIGAEAFDLLHAATNDPDPEVAASAHYLLRQISVRWVRSEDSPAVRRILFDYGDQADDVRTARVAQLARLGADEGFAGLCRIARFDRSPLISRAAALAIIRPDDATHRRSPLDDEVAAEELGPSKRDAVTWLRQFMKQESDPAAAVAAWKTLVDIETERLAERANETSSTIVLGLMWNLAELHRQLGHAEAVISVVDRMITLDENLADQAAVDLLKWMTEHKSWDVLDAFLAAHQPRLESAKRPLYFAALARHEQGQDSAADEMAERAASLEPQAPLEGFWIAKELEQRSKFDWAVREYRRVLETRRVGTRESNEAILARIELANMLFDYAKFESAAEALAPLVKNLRGNEQVSQLYAEMQRYYYRRYGLALPESDTLACRYHYYLACKYRDEQDWKRERDELQLAIRFDKTDADVLIAMYRVPEADDAWRAATRERIAKLCAEFQQEIDEAPSVAQAYNQWAWLVSNTEGDFQKAIRYSHRSIELNTGGESAEASYLDTLARCYYAAGDYENALKYQHEALQKVDHMQVMHRQLALFEKALAEKSTR